MRNTIALGAVLFVLLGIGGYMTMFSIPKKIKKSGPEGNRISHYIRHGTLR